MQPSQSSLSLSVGLRIAGGQPRNTFLKEIQSRAVTIVSLLILQSGSSFLLESYQKQLEAHLLTVLFLPMVIGAGGNAGCQAAVLVVQRLAGKGEKGVTPKKMARLLINESVQALFLGLLVAFVAAIRLMLSSTFSTDPIVGIVIILSIFLVVVASVLLGFVLPFILLAFNADPGIAGPGIQVIMDFLGVWITLSLLNWLLPLQN